MSVGGEKERDRERETTSNEDKAVPRYRKVESICTLQILTRPAKIAAVAREVNASRLAGVGVWPERGPV